MIELVNITKKYGSNEVLKNVNLRISDGEVYGLVGKNGAGKTTLLNILAGITEPTSGSCLVDKVEVKKGFIEKGKIGYLPDLPNFFEYLTGQEYLEFLSSAFRIDRSKEISELVSQLDLDLNKKIKALSRGNRQKLGILAAVLSKPMVLLLDEPTSALDPMGRKDTMAMIKTLKQSGISIILSTHILSDLEMVCDRIGFLHKGTIAKEVDLHAENADKTFYEITSDADSAAMLGKDLADRFPMFSISSERNKIFISENSAGRKLTWNELTAALTGMPISGMRSIERKGRHDLEQIMEEVLQS